jgi:hypothetical protein
MIVWFLSCLTRSFPFPEISYRRIRWKNDYVRWPWLEWGNTSHAIVQDTCLHSARRDWGKNENSLSVLEPHTSRIQARRDDVETSLTSFNSSHGAHMDTVGRWPISASNSRLSLPPHAGCMVMFWSIIPHTSLQKSAWNLGVSKTPVESRWILEVSTFSHHIWVSIIGKYVHVQWIFVSWRIGNTEMITEVLNLSFLFKSCYSYLILKWIIPAVINEQ